VLLNDRLRDARLMLIFTPELVPGAARDPELAVRALEAALPFVDAVQVRVKDPEDPALAAPARAARDWTRRVLELARDAPHAPLVLVNDRVDVALLLRAEGVAGVHLGADDCPPREARELLGPDALIGLSTHSSRDVARAAELPVDYLGFGPIHATGTKGYARGLGPEAAWIAQEATPLPVFPIGGIDATNAGDLAPLGRAAVASAVLAAPDPAAAARALRAALVAAEGAGLS